MNNYTEEAVVKIAVRKFNQRLSTAYRIEDALVYALEECDTGYDLSEFGYKRLLKKVEDKAKKYLT